MGDQLFAIGTPYTGLTLHKRPTVADVVCAPLTRIKMMKADHYLQIDKGRYLICSTMHWHAPLQFTSFERD